MHDDFMNVDTSERPAVENVHITEKESNVAEDLIQMKVMTKTACLNFETLGEQYFWSVSK